MANNDYRNNDKQNRVFFKKKRAGVALTKSEVEEIKAGRKKLREDMKAAGAYSKRSSSSPPPASACILTNTKVSVCCCGCFTAAPCGRCWAPRRC